MRLLQLAITLLVVEESLSKESFRLSELYGEKDSLGFVHENDEIWGISGNEAIGSYDPKSQDCAVVFAEDRKARFTVLTERLIRAEYSEDGRFLDVATMAVVNRKTPCTEFQYSVTTNKVGITTAYVNLTYTGGEFAEDSLSMVAMNPDSATAGFQPWYFGKPNPRQLHGTIRSLDRVGPISLNCSKIRHKIVDKEDLKCSEGIISRDGWVVLDDSNAPTIRDWWTYSDKGQDPTRRDIYLFAHGLDFRGALRDFVLISGQPSLPPKAAFGIWWTRWMSFTQNQIKDIVEEFKDLDLPLDIVTLDMNWHTKHDWTGYSWDRNLFPYPEDVLVELKEKYGLLFLANLHDADGISVYEEKFRDFQEYLQLPRSNDTIKFLSCTSPRYAFGLEDVVLDAIRLDGKGFDHWWIDWQQGDTLGGCKGGKHNPTIWLNRIRGLRSVRRKLNRRDMILARWGGVGSHRYPVGFSADVNQVSWSTLAYQPYFTATSSNIAYGYWSHDIVGPKSNPELFVRWIQWAAFSPVLRFHERGMSAGGCVEDILDDRAELRCSTGYPWDMPLDMLKAARKVMWERERLFPYIYSTVHEYWETGTSLLRPMYYDWPLLDEAYESCDAYGTMSQYMFGPDMLIAPIVSPREKINGTEGLLVSKTVWIPPGRWIEHNRGLRLDGPNHWTSEYMIDEVPIFVRAGAILPRVNLGRGLRSESSISSRRKYQEMEIEIILDPSITSQRIRIYHDNDNNDYLQRKNDLRTFLSYTYDSAHGLKISIKHDGEVSLVPDTIKIKLSNVKPLLNAPNEALYAGQDLSIVFPFPKNHSVVALDNVTVIEEPLLGQLSSCIKAKGVLDPTRSVPGANVGNLDSKLYHCTAVGSVLSHVSRTSPQDATKVIENALRVIFPEAIKEVDEIEKWKLHVAQASAILKRMGNHD